VVPDDAAAVIARRGVEEVIVPSGLLTGKQFRGLLAECKEAAAELKKFRSECSVQNLTDAGTKRGSSPNLQTCGSSSMSSSSPVSTAAASAPVQ
jgi:hypothetical protein